MRKIDNYFSDIPNSFTPQKLIDNGIIQRILSTKRVETTDYKGKNGEVKKSLLIIFSNCCAFCERRVGKYDDIEHFRPKHEITGVNTVGYYWLAVVWSNLLIACKDCNSDYKKNHFPIEGTRLVLPIETDLIAFFAKCQAELLVSEKHYLLHPVLDDPDEFLRFEENGTVTAKNNNNRGQMSIQYFGLSDWQNRQILIQDRKIIVDEVGKRVNHSVANFENPTRLFKDILNLFLDLIEQIEENRPYSAIRRSCLTNFKSFFIDKFSGVEKTRLIKAYDKVLKNIL